MTERGIGVEKGLDCNAPEWRGTARRDVGLGIGADWVGGYLVRSRRPGGRKADTRGELVVPKHRQARDEI